MKGQGASRRSGRNSNDGTRLLSVPVVAVNGQCTSS